VSKGIFCLEIGDWYGDMKKRETIRPVLELLHYSLLKVPFIYRDVATQSELNHYLNKWTQNKYKGFPILYMAFHGSPGEILVSEESGRSVRVGFDDLLDVLEGACHGKVIHFGACDTLNAHGSVLNRYLRSFDALAISGYKRQVDWIESSVFEMLYLSELQKNAMTKAGVMAVEKRIKEVVPSLARKLGFRMVVKK